jgi:hypothetical protein
LPEDKKPKTKRESPQFTGRVIAALYESGELLNLSGQALIGAELGERFGVLDVDGSKPVSYRETLGSPPDLHHTLKN